MRVIFDANVLLRMLLPSPNPNRAVNVLFDAAVGDAFTLLTTDELIDEVNRRSRDKPYLAARITPDQTRRFLDALRLAAMQLPRLLPPFPPVCRDPRDDYLLAYGHSARVDFLVTDDEDLLVLNGPFPFRILPPAAFLTVLRERGLA